MTILIWTAAKAKGIIVTNTPDVLNDATAEISMLLLLGAARRAYEGEHQIRTDAGRIGAQRFSWVNRSPVKSWAS